ncbi:hypothetical protein KCP70_13565 [Salmonella enterica subsp. enterica]|nr:hypothetical protein KCP70_13565 [Salmonella enterica subsp. enterica]
MLAFFDNYLMKLKTYGRRMKKRNEIRYQIAFVTLQNRLLDNLSAKLEQQLSTLIGWLSVKRNENQKHLTAYH